ncbi:hypothetical protein DESC_90020 [Desulfosarcina cetonica]|nr:hypothetical protein DESC_90020 [Desulfosarcina cetonica]
MWHNKFIIIMLFATIQWAGFFDKVGKSSWLINRQTSLTLQAVNIIDSPVKSSVTLLGPGPDGLEPYGRWSALRQIRPGWPRSRWRPPG